MTKQIVKATVVDDVLVPNPNGETEVIVDIEQNAGDCKTATLSFWGGIQGVVSYDETGERVVSHMALGIADTPNIATSIENIANVI
ncbi:hypothetical protein NFI00_000042 [Salmonella enterica]|nr:hypothetical protein [Salmonella enterica subsp. enterica serovar Minnesota]EJI5696339.1 hypothetical protein [Salmonella enterica]